MKSAITTLALALGLFVAVPDAHAIGQPGPAPAASGIEQVSGGCGRFGHRDRFGYCRPNRPPPRAYEPRRARPPYAAYRCPPGFHPTPHGCRRY